MIRQRPPQRLRFVCSPHYQDAPLYPIARQLERSAGFQADDTPAGKRDKLTRLLGRTARRIDVALLGDVVSIPGAEDDPGGLNPNSISGTPEQVAERFHALHQVGVEHINLFASPWGLKAVEYLGQTIKHLRAMGS